MQPTDLAPEFAQTSGFVLGDNESLSNAVNLTNRFIWRFVKNDHSRGSWRIVSGLPGTGKTRLARLVQRTCVCQLKEAKESRKTFHSPEIAFIRWPEVGSELTEDSKFAQIISDRIVPATLVVLDDLGSDTDAFRAKRPANRLQTLLDRCDKKWLFATTNLNSDQIKEHYGDRISSRLSRAVSVWIDAPDYRPNLKNK